MEGGRRTHRPIKGKCGGRLEGKAAEALDEVAAERLRDRLPAVTITPADVPSYFLCLYI